jgi:DNA repair protein RadC
MAEELDIPEAKTVQIVACAELGKRFFQKNTEGAAVLRTAKDVADYAYDMQHLTKEHLRGIYLNSHYQVIHDEVISIGTVDTNMVHPREVFRPAVAYGAVAVILVHNHPSGILKPSQADIEVTEHLIQAGKLMGIQVVDHVIVGKGKSTCVNAPYA